MLDDTQVLDEQLNRVGMEKVADVDLAENVRAQHWAGSYAELFVVDAPDTVPEKLQNFLSLLDKAIAARLRSARDKGEMRDAHVCILIDNGLFDKAALRSETEISRFVSRKYWIDRARPVEDILQRLTLSWVDVHLAFQSAPVLVSPELEGLRNRIAHLKGAGAANAFLDALK